MESKISNYINSLPENTFLWHWMEYCKKTYPKIVDKNWWTFFLTGCQLLAHASTLYIHRSKPMPGNFFNVLIGEPASGKGRVIDCLKDAIEGTWISEIPTGSIEAMEDELDRARSGILIWDEMGELGERQQSYLDKVKYMVNRAYYLDSITRARTTKKTTYMNAHSYYLSILMAGLPEDWKKIEKKFLGGFERRFLPLQVQTAKGPFEDSPYDPDALIHLRAIRDIINQFEDIAILVEPGDLSHLKDEVMEVKKRYWTLLEEYALKLDGVMRVNYATTDVPSLHQRLEPSPHLELLIDIDGVDCYVMDIDGVMETNDAHSFDSIIHQIPSMSIKMVKNNLEGFIDVADETLYRCLKKLEEYNSQNENSVLSKWKFASKVLGITNADYYKHVINALKEMGVIKVVSAGEGKPMVITDTRARLCPNCKHYNECYQWFSEGKVPEGSTVFSILPECDDFEQ